MRALRGPVGRYRGHLLQVVLSHPRPVSDGSHLDMATGWLWQQELCQECCQQRRLEAGSAPSMVMGKGAPEPSRALQGESGGKTLRPEVLAPPPRGARLMESPAQRR